MSLPSSHKPRFRDSFRVHFFRHGVYFASDRDLFVVRGTAAAALCAGIDGTRTVDEVVDRAAESAGYPEIYHALNQLTRKGLIVDSDGGGDATVPIDEMLLALGATRDPRSQTRLAIRNHSSVETETLTSHLERAGWSCSRDAEETDSDVAIVAVDDYLDPRLEDINSRLLASETPWLLIRPSGSVVRVGPLFRPGELCWACIAPRLSGADPIHRIHTFQNRPPETYPVQTPANALSASLCASTAASRLLSELAEPGDGDPSSSGGDILLFDTVRLALSRHPTARRPQCWACGDPGSMDRRAPPALDLEAARRFEGWRAVSSEKMLARVEPCFDEVTGVVMPITGASDSSLDVPGLFHIFTAKHPHKMNISAPDIHELYYMCSGKAQTQEEARLAAICEGVERYSCLDQGEDVFVSASYGEMRKRHPGRVLHPNSLMQYSDDQFEHRRELNRGASAFNKVPVRLDPRAQLRWARVWELSSASASPVCEEPHWVPAACLHFGLPPGDARFSFVSSSGLSAGASLEDALLHGFLEVFERDAVGIWWYNQVQRPALDLASCEDDFVHRMREYLARLGRELWILDVSNDLGLPTFAAVSCARESGGNLVYGFGCHFEALRSVHSALLELAQCLPIAFRWEQDGLLTWEFQGDDLQRWLETATLAHCPYLAPNGSKRALQDYEPPAHNVGDGLQYCISRVESLGLSSYVADLTRPDIGVPVAKAVVPGLRMFWNRFAPGRLYDVPVKLGWLDTPRDEADLNPFSVFF